MDDAVLKDLVEEELEWEPSVDATDIGVGVEDGVVTLMGYVSSFTQKMAAERAVSRVKGVRAIAQELEVRFAGMDTEADDRIAKRALDVLDWDVAIPSGAIKVKVQNGHVTLSGEVDWRYQANRARDKIDGLPGVKAVSNLIQIKPSRSRMARSHWKAMFTLGMIVKSPSRRRGPRPAFRMLLIAFASAEMGRIDEPY